MTSAGFVDVDRCWVCEGTTRAPVHDASFDLSEYASQDPELAAYSGASVPIVRCCAMRVCPTVAGAGACRTTSIGCTTSAGRRSGLSDEHHAGYKDLIFADILDALTAPAGAGPPPTARRRRARGPVRDARARSVAGTPKASS